MSQIDLPIIGVLEGAKALPHSAIASVNTYRDAVRMCWINRRVKGMTQQSLAEQSGMYPQHVTDYLNEQATDRHGKERREMPAKYIRAFEAVTGNTFVSQWVAYQSGLTVLQGLIAEQKAA